MKKSENIPYEINLILKINRPDIREACGACHDNIALEKIVVKGGVIEFGNDHRKYRVSKNSLTILGRYKNFIFPEEGLYNKLMNCTNLIA